MITKHFLKTLAIFITTIAFGLAILFIVSYLGQRKDIDSKDLSGNVYLFDAKAGLAE